MITVKDVLQLDSMKGARIVAGEDFINNQIESINVMDAPDSMSWVKPNELILTTGYPINIDPENLNYLISMLKEKGCAALGIKINRYFEIEGSTLLNLANKYGLPVISLPYASPFSQIISEVMMSMLNYINDENLKKVLDEALNEEDLDRFICTVSKLLEVNVSLESQYIESPICYNNGIYSETLMNSIRWEMDNNLNYFSEYYYAKDNRVVSININNFVQRHIFPVKFSNNTLGLLSLWKENENLLSNSQLITIDYIFSILRFMLRETKKKKLVDDKMNSIIGFELINYIPENKDLLNNKIKQLGLKLKSNFRVLTISGKNLNCYKEGIDDHNYSYLISKLNNIIINNASIKALSFFYEENLVIIFYNINLNNQNELENVIINIENILSASDIFVDSVKGKDLNIGLSKEHEKMERISKAYEESIIAIEIGKEKGIIMNKYVDIGFINHIFSKDGNKLNKIIKESIEPIISNTSDSGDLFYTLDTFFRNNESTIKTADQLFIHRNTLKYRLNQISEITGLDINKTSDKLSLYLGVLAYNLIKDNSK